MLRRVAWLSAFAAVAAVVFWLAYRPAQASAPVARRPSVSDGRQLFLRDCAVCHRPRGQGSDKAPKLTDVGTAAVDFMIRTGRMPLDHPGAKMERHDPKYDEAEIRSIDAYAATFTHGPQIPHVDINGANLRRGNSLYRENCAACHQAVGAGGALAFGEKAPPLNKATPLETVEAARIGPGQMPKFDHKTLDQRQATQVAAYVHYLHQPRDPGGWSLGHLGPVPEGLVAWALGLGALIIITALLGIRVMKHSD